MQLKQLLMIAAALVTAFLLGHPHAARAQSTDEGPGHFVTVSGGAWTGNGPDPIVKASVALRISPRFFAEGSASARWRRPHCTGAGDLPGCEISRHEALTLGGFFEVVGHDASWRSYVGASLGLARSGDLLGPNGNWVIGNVHAGFLQELSETVGARVEAVGQRVLGGFGGAYELLGGVYFRL